MDVSIVVPAYNEEGTIRELAKQVLDIFKINNYKGEIIFVNDGSTDATTEHCGSLAEEYDNISHIHFHRNKGKAAGLQAGFDAARGNYVITMDADLQDDPKEIPALIAKLEEGWDIVSGWKKKRHDPITKRWPSKLFNWAARVMSGIKIHDFNCGLKGYRNEVVKTVKLYGEMHRWIPVLAKVEGFKTTEIVVTHHPRTSGVSKYGFSRTFKGFFDFMTIFFLSRFTMRPMHFFGFFGLLSASAGVVIEIIVLIYKYAYGDSFQSHMAMLILGVLLIVLGVQLFSIGLIGEMLVYQSKKEEINMKEYAYRFSVIVPTFNRLGEIRELLASLERQTLPKDKFEIIIVDDGSTDQTEAFVLELIEKKSLNLSFYKQDHKGPGPARNTGMEKARGEYYIFVDSDCIADENWLKAYDDAITEPVAGFGGPDKVRSDFSPLQKSIDYSMTSFITTGGIRGSSKKKISKYYPRSFNMGVHAEVYEKIGGFGTLRHGQDIEFTHRIRSQGETVKVMEAVVFHKRRTSLWRFFKQVYNWGVARINLYKIDKGMLEFIHFFPFLGTLFILGFLICFAIWPAILLPYLAAGIGLLIAMGIHGIFKYKDIRVFAYIPFVVPIQILGYGLGFGGAFIRRVILGGREKTGFVKNYYK